MIDNSESMKKKRLHFFSQLKEKIKEGDDFSVNNLVNFFLQNDFGFITSEKYKSEYIQKLILKTKEREKERKKQKESTQDLENQIEDLENLIDLFQDTLDKNQNGEFQDNTEFNEYIYENLEDFEKNSKSIFK